jgi:lysophospholipase L1-like esterase
MRQVSRRTHLFSSVNAYTSSMSRTWDSLAVDVTAIEVTLCNWYVRQSDGAEAGPGGPTTFAVAIEYPAGVFTQLTQAGNATPSIADGANATFTGNVTIPKNTTFWHRIYATNAGGQMVNVNFANSYDPSRGDAFTFNGPNQTMGGTLDDNGSSSFCVFPAMVRALSTLGVWVAFGDSTCNGVTDTIPDATGATGWYGRALSAKGPYCNFGCSGDQMTWFVNNSTKRRALAALAGMTKGINGYGINDITQNRSQAQLEADRATFMSLFPGKPIYNITIPPKTGGGPTAAGQSEDAVKGALRIAYNTAARAGIAGSAGLIDIASVVETDNLHETTTVLNGGVWLPAAWGDGTHPNTAGYKLVTPLVAAL